MSRNMVIGKFKYLIGLASGTILHSLLDEVQDARYMQVQGMLML